MTDVAVETETVRVKITMAELDIRTLEGVQEQLDAVVNLLTYAQYAEYTAAGVFDREHWKSQQRIKAPWRWLPYRAIRRLRRLRRTTISVQGTPYRPVLSDVAAVEIEQLTLASPLNMILTAIPVAVAMSLFKIVNAFNDMRAKHAETNTLVARERMEQDAIAVIREHLADKSPRSAAVAEAAEKVIADAGAALMDVSELQLLQSGETT